MPIGTYVFRSGETFDENKVNVKFFASVNSANIVTAVNAVSNHDCLDSNGEHSEEVGALFLRNLLQIPDDIQIIETWHYRQSRNTLAIPNSTYDPNLDIFIDPRISPSFILDDNHDWVPLAPKPQDGKNYLYDLNADRWIEYSDEPVYRVGENGVMIDDDGNPLQVD